MAEQNEEESSLHGYRIGKLEQSDEKQWRHIDGHNRWIAEIHVAVKAVKTGTVIIVTLLAGLAALVKMGPEKLLEWWLK